MMNCLNTMLPIHSLLNPENDLKNVPLHITLCSVFQVALRGKGVAYILFVRLRAHIPGTCGRGKCAKPSSHARRLLRTRYARLAVTPDNEEIATADRRHL